MYKQRQREEIIKQQHHRDVVPLNSFNSTKITILPKLIYGEEMIGHRARFGEIVDLLFLWQAKPHSKPVMLSV